MQNRSPPAGVFVLTVLAIIDGVIFLAGGGNLLFVGFTLGTPLWDLVGAGDLILGTVAVITGVGFLNARSWSRIIGFALIPVALIASGLIVSVGTHEGLSLEYSGLFYGVPFAIVMVYYLTRYDVQAYLQHGKPQVQNR